MIKVKNLNKYYNKGKSNELHVINNTTIELPDTGLICILGESGSGKTTLMNTISGLDDFADGIIDVDGTEIKKYGDANQERVRNEKFGYIFQNYYLLQDRTVEYNLMLALGLYNISDEEKAERIDYVLKAVDMWRYKKRLVSQLSGGQQQRIAIARALAKSPKVIFADEPTGNLDEANTMRTMGILKKISDKCLVVVVTHEKSIADFFADRILWIADGQIKDDKEKTNHGVYTYVEDTNIYLGEYEKRELSDDNVALEVYDNGEKPEIGLKIVCDNGKIYISVDDMKNIEILTSESEKKMLEGNRPVVEMTDVNEMDYSLSELEYAKKPKLSFKEIRAIAYGNIKTMGKKQAFLVISLIAMAVMMVLAIQDIMNIISINPEEVVSTDSHYVEVSMEKTGFITASKFNETKHKFMQTLQDDNEVIDDVVLNPGTNLSYVYTGFSQLENVTTVITDFSFVPIEKLSEDDLIYGRMPKNENEIVVDKWVLEHYVETSNELKNVISNIKHFLNKQMTTANGATFEVVGIAESEEMDIYISKEKLSKLTSKLPNYMTYSEFKEAYPDAYTGEELTLGEDGKYEILVNKYEYMENFETYATNKNPLIGLYEQALQQYENSVARYERLVEQGRRQEDIDYAKIVMHDCKTELAAREAEMLEYYGKDSYEQCLKEMNDYEGYTYSKNISTGAEYTVVGFYDPDKSFGMEAQLIVADGAKDYITSDIIASFGKFYIYTDNQEETIEYLNSIAKKYDNELILKAVNPYDEAMDEYKADKSMQFDARIIITITIFVVSMLILYFMMKANAVQRMGDLGVYRLIGISKKSIIGLFAYENVVISTYTSLVGAVLTTLVTYLISSIPSLGMEMNYPWYAFLGTVVFLYAINVIIGILPIRKILRLPPAQLATKYDI